MSSPDDSIKHISETLKRKVFTENNYTICACGCLFVNKQSKKILLMQYLDVETKLDDFGGKVDHQDRDKFETICREVSEESNGIINRQIILNLTRTNKCFGCYTESSKYFFLTIEVDDTFYPDTSIFGNREIYENINRVINWHNINDVLRNKKLAHRILCAGMLEYLRDL